ncbi:MAG: hypothetical protein GY803_16425 [Chloroflexi bacterium]|nr:hypothetical protein [Chloroflexota bacterium]
MVILHGRLQLFGPEQPRGFRLPIDYFFRLLARDRGRLSVGIVLSGTGTDDSLGLKAIKEAGGLISHYAEEEALSMNIAEILPAGKKQDVPSFTPCGTSGDKIVSFEIQRLTKDGRVIDNKITKELWAFLCSQFNHVGITKQCRLLK